MVKSLKQPEIYTVASSGEVVMPAATITKNGAGSSRQTVALGTAILDFAYAYANCTGVKVEGLPKGVTATLNTSDKKIYISGTPTEIGTFAFTATTVGGTGDAASLSGQIVVTDPSIPQSSSSFVPEESSSSEGGKPTISTNYPSEVNAAIPDEMLGVYEEYNAGWLDSGYFNSDNAVGSYGVWELYSKKAGEVTVTVRFANGGADPRNMMLSINGVDVREVEFASTDGWTNWMETEVKVKLAEGKNTLKLTAVSALGGPNVDLFYFDQADICLYRDYESGKVKFEDENPEDPAAVQSVVNVRGIVGYNPVSGVIRTSESGFAEVYYYDMSGTMKYGMSAEVPAGETLLKADGEMLPKGVYFVKVKFNGRMISKTKVSNR